MGKQSKLEEIAIATRKTILTNNTFNNFDSNNNYSVTHTNAVSDDETPKHGKGTGVFLDVENGGSIQDTYGVSHVAGSGRIGNTIINEYNKQNTYKTPDTTGNIGQVTI